LTNYSNESHDCVTSVCDHDPPEHWKQLALCGKLKDKDIMFPDEPDDLVGITVAKSVCQSCTVKHFCLELGWADEFGIWGGYSAADRIRLKRWLRLPAKASPIRRLVRTLALIER
jgi:hypothetical protein